MFLEQLLHLVTILRHRTVDHSWPEPAVNRAIVAISRIDLYDLNGFIGISHPGAGLHQTRQRLL